MDLSPYVESVREGVVAAATLADEQTQQVAHKLGAAIGSSTRLALIRALSDATSQISADLAPASVRLQLDGEDPEFVVSVPPPTGEPTLILNQPDPAEEAEEIDADEPVARVSLRLPTSVKTKVDDMADKEGISTNAWLMRAVMDALGGRSHRLEPPQPPHPFGGFFGPDGPFGTDGPFGPGGVFGPGGKHKPGHRGRVQGWVQ